MADPLQLLSEYARQRLTAREIVHNGEKYIAFGEYAYPKDTPTQLLVYGKDNEHYSIESVMFLCDRMQLTHTSYVKEAASNGIRAITRPDRRDIIEFLCGRRTELPANSDNRNPPSAPIPVSRLVPEPSEPEKKKAKLDIQPETSSFANKKPRIGAEPTELRSLNEDLTADKIAALKAKKANHQKKNIATIVEDENDPSGEMSMALDKEFKNRERVWKTRDNCLEATSKTFTNILDTLKAIKVREENEQRQKAMGMFQPPTNKPNNQAQQRANRGGYSRYDQEIFNKEMNSDFQIDAALSFVGKNLQSLNKAAATEQKPAFGSASQPTPGPYGRQSNNHGAPTSNDTATNGNAPRKRTNRTPIILIPSGATSLITMYNVQDILQNMRFISTEKKKEMNLKRDTEVQVHRKRGEKGEITVPYRIVDNALKLNDDEWDRVVAVFVMGPAWQFKGWKYNGNPVEIFAHIPAFHLYYDDMKVDVNVAKWNVTLLPIARDKRHLDRARLARFWDVLDRHILKNKSYLRY